MCYFVTYLKKGSPFLQLVRLLGSNLSLTPPTKPDFCCELGFIHHLPLTMNVSGLSNFIRIILMLTPYLEKC